MEILPGIPKLMHSVEKAGLFEYCIECGEYLLDDNKHYIIEKAFTDLETIFELAMCWECYMSYYETLSLISREKLEQYFAKHIRDFERSNVIERNGYDFDKWTENCIVKDIPEHETKFRQICVHCLGENLVYDLMPFMLSDTALEDIYPLLSKQTKDEIDRFNDRFFGFPPELAIDIKTKEIVFV